ncbi:MAG: hypothetical protein U0228_25570 [Myxococcaceae bacterium]
MRKAWPIAGAILGAVTSVTPLELGLCLAPCATVLLLLASTSPSRRPTDREFKAFALLAAAIPAITLLIPLKYIDRETVTLTAGCHALSELHGARFATDRRMRLSAHPTPEPQLCFDEPNPTLRQLRTQLEKSGLTLKLPYCGNGATFLLGAYPINVTAAAP